MPHRIETLVNSLQRIDHQVPQKGIAKHRKMARSPFVFFRGSAQLFYADLASGQLPLPEALYNIPMTTIMGDCHSSNFGFLSEEGSHGEKIIFSPNDFDDACIGHAAWDLARFCTSLVLCANHCQGIKTGRYSGSGDKDLSHKGAVDSDTVALAINAFLNSYLDSCNNSDEEIDKALEHFSEDHILFKPWQKALSRSAGGSRFLEKSALAKAVDIESMPLRFLQRPERFQALSKEAYIELEQQFAPYMDDSILDIVQRLDAGTGSVNMSRYYFLVGPKDYQDKSEINLCHIVEVKLQREAAAIYYFPELSPNNRLNPAHLTVMCQRRMQRAPDLVLDEAEWQQQHWLIRSRHHAKVGIDPEDIAMGKKACHEGGFIQYAQSCGRSLALAHCRGDKRSRRFEQAVATYLPSAMDELHHQCESYAHTVIADTQLLQSLLPE